VIRFGYICRKKSEKVCATPLGSYEHAVVEQVTVRLHRLFKRRLLAKTPSEQERYATDNLQLER
jgi:hypothetical protein